MFEGGAVMKLFGYKGREKRQNSRTQETCNQMRELLRGNGRERKSSRHRRASALPVPECFAKRRSQKLCLEEMILPNA